MDSTLRADAQHVCAHCRGEIERPEDGRVLDVFTGPGYTRMLVHNKCAASVIAAASVRMTMRSAGR